MIWTENEVLVSGRVECGPCSNLSLEDGHQHIQGCLRTSVDVLMPLGRADDVGPAWKATWTFRDTSFMFNNLVWSIFRVTARTGSIVSIIGSSDRRRVANHSLVPRLRFLNIIPPLTIPKIAQTPPPCLRTSPPESNPPNSGKEAPDNRATHHIRRIVAVIFDPGDSDPECQRDRQEAEEDVGEMEGDAVEWEEGWKMRQQIERCVGHSDKAA